MNSGSTGDISLNLSLCHSSYSNLDQKAFTIDRLISRALLVRAIMVKFPGGQTLHHLDKVADRLVNFLPKSLILSSP